MGLTADVARMVKNSGATITTTGKLKGGDAELFSKIYDGGAVSNIFYTPKGAAAEYGEMALNYYQSCDHACKYCYCPAFLKMDRNEFYTGTKTTKNYQARLIRDATKANGQTVFLNFIGDPYQAKERTLQFTRDALQVFEVFGIRPKILTKSGTWGLMRDAGYLMATAAMWGVTLTCNTDAGSLEWEPGAALPADRIESLKLAQELGLQTWVSFEPVIYPDQTLELIQQAAPYADRIAVGKLNHYANATDWKQFRFDAEELLKSTGNPYTIKQALKEV